MTAATGALDIDAIAKWTVNGGGQSPKASVEDKVCHDEPITTTEGPPVEVGSAQAERPNVPTSVESAAAAAVTAEPRFTG